LNQFHRLGEALAEGAVAPSPEKHREYEDSVRADVYNSVSWY
jgi:hypothetical protein